MGPSEIAAEHLLGVWDLKSFVRTSADETTVAPFADNPPGRISYQPGGFIMHPE